LPDLPANGFPGRCAADGAAVLRQLPCVRWVEKPDARLRAFVLADAPARLLGLIPAPPRLRCAP
jgi:hypothetical protein